MLEERVKANTMRKIRLIHNYVGLFFAPMILLFALSGALQTFRLQETHDPAAYTPPSWIVWLAAVHKDQALSHGEPKRKPPSPPSGQFEMHHEAPPPAPPTRMLSPLPLKIFVTGLSIGLILSTLLGITIALNNRSTRRISLILLAAGAGVPLLLLLL